eukprot:3079666-Rhodomonas_salina.1
MAVNAGSSNYRAAIQDWHEFVSSLDDVFDRKDNQGGCSPSKPERILEGSDEESAWSNNEEEVSEQEGSSDSSSDEDELRRTRVQVDVPRNQKAVPELASDEEA